MAALPPTAAQLARGHAPARDREADRRYDEARKGDPAWGELKTARWQRVRAMKLSRDPLCEPCKARGRLVAAAQVHHRESRRARPDLIYRVDNLQSVCHVCHARESAKERA